MNEKFVEKSFVHEKPLYMKREQKKVKDKLSAIKLPPMCKVNYCPCHEYKNHLCWSHSKLP